MHTAQPGNLALLVGRDRKSFLVRLEPGSQLQTHRGVVPHDAVIGKRWGAPLATHTGYPLSLFRPTTDDLVRELSRSTQITYPKDAGYTLMKLGIKAGSRVVEAGIGNGALTTLLAQTVGATGRIYSYESRRDTQSLARKNLQRPGLCNHVELELQDIADGLDEVDMDALFLDLPTPWRYLEQAHGALVGSGFFGCLLPTANQVSRLIRGLERHLFSQIEVEELLLRPYKAVASRLRPMDRMIAHTGYLIFARALI